MLSVNRPQSSQKVDKLLAEIFIGKLEINLHIANQFPQMGYD